MKAAIFSWDPAEVEEVIVALRLRWPDVSALVASNGRSDLATVEQAEPDVVILHGHLPDIDVWSAIRQIRLASDVPILVAMQSDNDMDAVKAFDAGADEYVSLPCDLMAFVARVIALLPKRQQDQAKLRRVGVTKPGAQGAVIRCGELLIDPDELAAYLGSERLRLTHTEFRLLYVLAKSSQITLSPEYIRRAIWGDHDDVEGILKKYIQRVRQKLGDDAKNPQWIRTVHGVGYRLLAPGPTVTTEAKVREKQVVLAL